MKPDDFLMTALALIPYGSKTSVFPEAHCRTSISRSYYGAHHIVVAALAEFGWHVSRASYGHDEAQEMLKVSGHPMLTAAGLDLANLYQRRCDADYDLQPKQTQRRHHTETSGYAMSTHAIATKVQRATAAMLTEPLRSLVAEAIAATFVARWLYTHSGEPLPRWRPMNRDRKGAR